MKLCIYFCLFIHVTTSIFASIRFQNDFHNCTSVLKKNNWKERFDALTTEQHGAYSEYLNNHPDKKNNDLSAASFGDILIQGLDLVEKKQENIPDYITAPIDPQVKLYRAILNDSPYEIELAVNTGAEVNKNFSSDYVLPYLYNRDSALPLCVSILLSKQNAVKKLLQHGANPNVRYDGPSIVSHAQHHHPRPSITYPSYTLIKHALLLGDMRSALALVEHGAAIPNCLHPEGCFHQENCSHGGSYTYDDIKYSSIMTLFNFYHQDRDTALQLIKKAIDKRKSKSHITDHDMSLILRYAISHPKSPSENILDEKLLTSLLEWGAPINALSNIEPNSPYSSRVTPLCLAIQNSHYDTVTLLTKHGADVTISSSIYDNKLFKRIDKTPHNLAQTTRDAAAAFKDRTCSVFKDNNEPSAKRNCLEATKKLENAQKIYDFINEKINPPQVQNTQARDRATAAKIRRQKNATSLSKNHVNEN